MGLQTEHFPTLVSGSVQITFSFQYGGQAFVRISVVRPRTQCQDEFSHGSVRVALRRQLNAAVIVRRSATWIRRLGRMILLGGALHN
jgi:hypothetical protein